LVFFAAFHHLNNAIGPRPARSSAPQLTRYKPRVVFSARQIFGMAREKSGHSLNGSIAYTFPIGQACGASHSTANALFAGFLSGQAAFAMLFTKLETATRCGPDRRWRGK
jgi:hypothetical protein